MKKNVASQVIGVQMISASDGSAFTGAVSCLVTGDGGTQTAGGGSVTHEGNGFHSYAPTQAETNYNHIGFTFTGTGAIPATVQLFTSFPQTGDSFGLIGTAGAGLTNIGTIATVTNLTNLPTIPTNWITAAGIAADAIGASELATDAVTEIVNAVWANATRTVTAATNITSTGGTTVPQTGDSFARIGAAGAGLTAVPWNASWDAEVQSECADALAVYDPPTNAEMEARTLVAAGYATPTNITAGTITTATNVTTVNGLAANVITAASIATDAGAEIADAVWDEAIAGHLTAGSTGAALNGATAPTAAAVADAVWDEALAGHLSAGSTGEALNAAGAAGDPWTTTLPGAYAGAQAGKMLSDILTDTAEIGAAGAGLTALASAANLATVDTVVDSILLDTAEIGAAGAGLTAVPWNAAWDAEVQSECTDALNAYDPPTKAELDSAVAPLATAANLATVAGYVDTEVAAIKAKTDNLPAAPAAVGDIPTAIQNADALLNRDMSAVSDTNARTPLNALRLLRNKWTSAAGTLTVTKEDDTTSAWTSVLSGDAAADPVVGSDPA